MGRKPIDLTGQRFGRLTVLYKSPTVKAGEIKWNCICDCGNTVEVLSSQLRSGKTKSCGCARKGVNKKHNHYEFCEDYVKVFPQDRNDLCTLLDYKWYEYFKEKYIMPKKDRKDYYWVIKENGKIIRIHQIICGKYCDHINLNKSDNRENNLRIASIAQNSYNRSLNRNNKTGFKGVQFDKNANSFCAQLRYNNKLMYWGGFQTAEDAAKQYDKAAIKYFGEYAWLNFPRENYELNECTKIEPSTMKNRQRTYKTEEI